MEKLRKQAVRGSILLEALLAFSVFAFIATFLLAHIHESRKEQAQQLAQEEVFRTAKMALQTEQSDVAVNGVAIHVEKSAQALTVYHGKEEIIRVEK
ncbi:competence type IV pilus minor pilin ComGE [Streptococcus pneumoniae]